MCVCREMQAVENLLSIMSSVVQRHKKQLQLRSMYCEERVWKAHLNYSVAQAHFALLYQGLDQLHGGALQHRFIIYFNSPFLCFCIDPSYQFLSTQGVASLNHFFVCFFCFILHIQY